MFLCLSYFLISCSANQFKTEKELLDYLHNEENGYSKSKTINNVHFKLTYKPTDMLVNQELDKNNITDSIVNALRAKYNKYLYFNLSMSKNNQEVLSGLAGNRNEFGAMVNQLAFGMNNKVHLYTKEKDTIELADFVYPRMYGMSQSTDILFVYPREIANLKTQVLNFTIEDLGLYTGEVKFKIETENIKKEPQLSFKN